MGWAKYYEDNMSIYIGRMVMRETTPVYCEKHKSIKKPAIKLEPSRRKKGNIVIDSPRITQNLSERKGLKVVFQNGVDERMIRKMQMNGWWWSKANACWYNRDTSGNRKYAKGLVEMGAKASIVE